MSTSNNSSDRYVWSSAVTADYNFPMQVVSGSFLDKDGGRITWVPSGNAAVLDAGWGIKFGSYGVGSDTKPLPAKLEITMFSYTEDKFYKTSVDLDYEKIKARFKVGYKLYGSRKDGQPEQKNYEDILVGIAPGGAVAVWLFGIGDLVEVGFGQGREIEMDHLVLHPGSPGISREEWIRGELIGDYGRLNQKRFKYLEERDQINRHWYSWDELKKNGVPLGFWSMYREQYDWELVFEGKGEPRSLYIDYFNGEGSEIIKAERIMKVSQVVPKMVAAKWTKLDGEKMGSVIFFNQEEIFPAFQKLSKGNEKVQLVFTFYENLVTTVKLRNSHEEIKLKGRTFREG